MHRRDFLKRIVTGAAVLAVPHPIGLLPATHAAPGSLLWYVEDWSGRVISTWQPDRLANPASVTKLATSLLALDHYTPSFRYRTTFVPGGPIDPSTHTLRGNLHVYASGDPDFQFENALLVAAQLNRLGIEDIRGHLVIHGHFHMRWNNGWVPTHRAQWKRYVIGKGAYLRQAWDPGRWRASDKQAWEQLCERLQVLQRGSMLSGFRGLKVEGHIRAVSASHVPERRLAVIHHSNPLLRILKRFNSFSNNDIERIGQQLGGPRALKRFLVKQVGLSSNRVRFSSTSGLGENRLSPRTTVRVVRRLIELGQRYEFGLTDILPVAGVDQGTLQDRFCQPGYSGSIVAKSGQLVRTDGGVSTLSGLTCTQTGPLLFAIFHRRTYRRLPAARNEVDRTLLRFIDQMGGPAPLEYDPASFLLPYDQAQIEVVNEDAADSLPPSHAVRRGSPGEHSSSAPA